MKALCTAWAILITGVFLYSCDTQATLVDMEGKRIAPVPVLATPVLAAHARYKEDIVFMPKGTEIHYRNLVIITKHKGYYFSERYQEFSVKELLRVISGEKLEMTGEARGDRWQEYIENG